MKQWDWKSLGGHMVKAARKRDLPGLAQQIAYNILFALAPMLIFVTAFCGLVVQRVNSDARNPVQPITDWLNANLPAEAADFLRQPVENALSTSPGFLLSTGGVLALWGAKGAMGAVMKGLNAAYGIKESRSWVVATLVSIGLTIALAVAVLLSAGLLFLGTDAGFKVADKIGLGTAWATVSSWARWPFLAASVIVIIVLLHRFAPDRKADLRSYLPGAVATLLLIVLATLGLRIYFAVSGGFGAAYGAFGAVLAFVFYLYVIGLVILVGGVINATVQDDQMPSSVRNGSDATSSADDQDTAKA